MSYDQYYSFLIIPDNCSVQKIKVKFLDKDVTKEDKINFDIGFNLELDNNFLLVNKTRLGFKYEIFYNTEGAKRLIEQNRKNHWKLISDKHYTLYDCLFVLKLLNQLKDIVYKEDKEDTDTDEDELDEDDIEQEDNR